jgi:PAS domain S-box-containing protein
MKRFLKYLSLYLFLAGVVYIVLLNQEEKKIKEHLDSKTAQYLQSYKLLYSEQKELASVVFLTKIDTPQVKELFEKKDRTALYNSLEETYLILKKFNIKQLHFHLPNNESFLRFHRPNKFGDDLSEIRPTVVYVNKNHKEIDGFEEGRIYNGYRYVYPLFKKDKYLGSVEISFSTLAMNLEFIEDYNVFSTFLILKSTVDTKLFQEEKKNYVPSMLEDFYIEKAMLESLSELNKKKNLLSPQTLQRVHESKDSQDSFSVYDLLSKEIATFIKVKNPITGKVVGLFIVRSGAEYIFAKQSDFYLKLFLFNLLIAAVLLYICRERLYKKKIADFNKTLEDKVITQVKEIKESEAFHQTIFNATNDAIAILDLESNFLLVNDTYVRMTGYTKEELYKTSCRQLTVPSMRDTTDEVRLGILKTGFYKGYEKSCITKDGAVIDVQMDIVLMPSKDKFLISASDVTEENRLKREKFLHQKQLLQHSRMAQMGEMISMIAHQWRQPLAAISATVMNLEIKLVLGTFDLREEDGREQQKNYYLTNFKNIENFVTNLSATIDDFRNFYKPNKVLTKTTLKTVVERAMKLVEVSLQDDNIQVKYEYKTITDIEVYENEMMQVVLNILKNAQDNFLEKNIQNPKITITVDDKILTICDNGGGIKEKIINKVFDPYFSTKEKLNGTGLGLYMSQIIIHEHHNGTISVENINRGACFKITL